MKIILHITQESCLYSFDLRNFSQIATLYNIFKTLVNIIALWLTVY